MRWVSVLVFLHTARIVNKLFQTSFLEGSSFVEVSWIMKSSYLQLWSLSRNTYVSNTSGKALRPLREANGAQ